MKRWIILAWISLTTLTINTAFAATVNPLITQTLKQFPLCNVNQLVINLSSTFQVKTIADQDANYTYYLVVEEQDVNADAIRHATCKYILANSCYVYWGNVANMAMIAGKKAAWFPLDTSPHYMISPIITCNHAK